MNGSGEKQESRKQKKDGILIKTTLVDFPSELSSAFFLPGCNLRCPYCQNRELVLPLLLQEQENENLVSIEDLFTHLERRKNVLSGLVISGGEPLLNSRTKEILSRAKKLGYKTKLDTNGTFPEKLEDILENPETRPDYVALDVKTSPEKYFEMLTEYSRNSVSQNDSQDRMKTSQTKAVNTQETATAQNSVPEKLKTALAEKIKKSIKIISALPPKSYEIRTVLVPGITTKDDIENISFLLNKDASWYLAHFSNISCLSKTFENLQPYSREEEQTLLDTARKRVKNTFLR